MLPGHSYLVRVSITADGISSIRPIHALGVLLSVLLDESRDVLCAFLEGRHDEDKYVEAVLEVNDRLLLPLRS